MSTRVSHAHCVSTNCVCGGACPPRRKARRATALSRLDDSAGRAVRAECSTAPHAPSPSGRAQRLRTPLCTAHSGRLVTRWRAHPPHRQANLRLQHADGRHAAALLGLILAAAAPPHRRLHRPIRHRARGARPLVDSRKRTRFGRLHTLCPRLHTPPRRDAAPSRTPHPSPHSHPAESWRCIRRGGVAADRGVRDHREHAARLRAGARARVRALPLSGHLVWAAQAGALYRQQR
eukprot:7389826-Prymnesium_polylepis.2